MANDRPMLIKMCRQIIEEIYVRDRRRARRGRWNVLGYILATKTLLAIGVESIYVSLLKEGVHYTAFAINVFFHPALLFFSTLGISRPVTKNTERIIQYIEAIAYNETLPKLTVRNNRGGILGDMISGFYVVLFFALCAGISQVLLSLKFHVFDIFLFLLFIVIVTYFAFRIRVSARSMELRESDEGFFSSFFTLLLLPVIRAGRYLVRKFERVNVIAVFMDVFIEIPFKLLLQFFDSISQVLKEKRNDLYS